MAVCAWVSVPLGTLRLSMQMFGVFLTLGVLGGRRGTAAIAVYLLLGAVGVPVFAGFQGGIGVLVGATGGYLMGFLACGIVYGLAQAHGIGKTGAMLLGLLACYCIGTLWYRFVYLPQGSLWAAVAQCVLPYILPDVLKLCLARLLLRRINKSIRP